MKGITAYLLKCGHGSHLNKFEELVKVTVPCEGGAFEPKEDAPEVVLVIRKLRFKSKFPHIEDYIHAEPKDKPEGETYAFGGNFIYCSDSRFPSQYPIPLHDRRMNLENSNSHG